MAQLYTNAADVLPPELLAQVQKHWQGMIWVPARTPAAHDDVLLLVRNGLSADAVAASLGISISRVYQLARSLGRHNPFRKRGKNRTRRFIRWFPSNGKKRSQMLGNPPTPNKAQRSDSTRQQTP